MEEEANVVVVGEGAGAGETAPASSGDESGGEVYCGVCGDTVGRPRKKEGAVGEIEDARREEEKQAVTLEEKTLEFWRFFKNKVSKWNPCHMEVDPLKCILRSKSMPNFWCCACNAEGVFFWIESSGTGRQWRSAR